MCWCGPRGEPGEPGIIEKCYKCGSDIIDYEHCKYCDTSQLEYNRLVMETNLIRYGFKKKLSKLKEYYIFADLITAVFIYDKSNIHLKINIEEEEDQKIVYYSSDYEIVKTRLERFINTNQINREIKLNKLL